MNKGSMIKVIFFDFDGVILESVDIKTNAFADLFKNEGKVIQKQVVDYHLKNTGVSRFDKFKYIYKEFLKRQLDDNEFDRLCNTFEDLVFNAIIRAPFVKGAKKFLQDRSSDYRCFIVSATPQDEIEKIVKERNIDHYFEGVYGSPIDKAEAVQVIIDKIELDPSQAVFIGDAMSDYVAAKSNNINFIARINNNESIFEDIDCLKVNDLSQINELIRGFDKQLI